MTVITRTVTAGSVGSGERYFRFRSKCKHTPRTRNL
jgi:hypothetical protein